MWRAIRVVTIETFTLLRRDKVFLPALLAALVVSGFANLASDWSTEDFSKVLYDIGFAGFQITGSLVAIFWGAKSVSDSRQEGSLEVQLAAPIGRSVWLVGKFFGLSLCLLLLAGILVGVWQGAMLLGNFGWMTGPQLSVFGFMALGWLVLAALALLLSSLMRQALALFCTLILWLTGLATALVANTMGPTSPPSTRAVVHFMARYWDLQQFNLADHAMDPSLLPLAELTSRGGYGVMLIVAVISVACVLFQRRDVIG